MKIIHAAAFGLFLASQSAFAAESFVVNTEVRRGSVDNLYATNVQDNVSATLNTNSRGRFTAIFNFDAVESDNNAEFNLRIAFQGSGRYRFYVQKQNSSWERFTQVRNPANGYQTFSFQTNQSISNYVNDGAIRFAVATSSNASAMNLDYLALSVDGVQQDAPAEPSVPEDTNSSPVANGIQVDTDVNTAKRINIYDSTSDSDGDTLTVSIAAQPNNGSATVSGALVTYTPNTGFTGTDNFVYSVDDGNGGSASASITVNVIQEVTNDDFNNIALTSSITGVQPMTGIVLWAEQHNSTLLKTSSEYTQLEYAYLDPSETVIGDGVYNWSSIDSLLEGVRGRGKQAILRFSYVLPGAQTTVPSYIKALSGYNETSGTTEGQLTYFPDWSNQSFQNMHQDLYTAFAARYDDDARVAFLQIGFGLWGEYHIYEPGVQLGVNFPSKQYQTTFLNHVDNIFDTLKWNVSIDAGDSSIAPFAGDSSVMGLEFGLIDDSFMHNNHGDYNEVMWNLFGYQQRYEHSPMGGEFSYYTTYDQQNVLNVDGIHGRVFEEQSEKFNVTYMIGNDQPDYQSNDRIRDAGMSTGYRFEITSFQASSSASRVTVTNNGVAPIYYDAYVTVNNVAATGSLKGLLPGQSSTFTIAAGGTSPVVTIESDRLVDGQTIEFEANL